MSEVKDHVYIQVDSINSPESGSCTSTSCKDLNQMFSWL